MGFLTWRGARITGVDDKVDITLEVLVGVFSLPLLVNPRNRVAVLVLAQCSMPYMALRVPGPVPSAMPYMTLRVPGPSATTGQSHHHHGLDVRGTAGRQPHPQQHLIAHMALQRLRGPAAGGAAHLSVNQEQRPALFFLNKNHSHARVPATSRRHGHPLTRDNLPSVHAAPQVWSTTSAASVPCSSRAAPPEAMGPCTCACALPC